MNDTKTKYKKARYIVIATMCTNPDPNIDPTH